MSESGSEHDDDDLGPDSDSQEPRRKVFVVSTLPWRSNELGQVMRRCHSGFGPPSPNPLADLDPPKKTFLLSNLF